jgi:hypothetical protein
MKTDETESINLLISLLNLRHDAEMHVVFAKISDPNNYMEGVKMFVREMQTHNIGIRMLLDGKYLELPEWFNNNTSEEAVEKVRNSIQLENI